MATTYDPISGLAYMQPGQSGVLLFNAWMQWLTGSGGPKLEVIAIPCSDLTTLLTTGTGKGYCRMPFAITVTAVRGSCFEAPTGSGNLTIDINEAGATILSTKLTFNASSKTTVGASVPYVLSDTAIADDAEITVDIDAIAGTTAGKGLIIYIIGYRA